MLALLLIALAIPASAETVHLIRDASNTPHIYASTPAGAAFAAGYAQAEDRPEALLRNLQAQPPELIELPRTLAVLVDAYVRGVQRSFTEHGRKETVTAQQVATFAQYAYTWILGSHDFALAPSRTTNRAPIVVLDPLADWDAPTRPYEMSLYAEGLAVAGVAPVGMPFPVVGHNASISFGWAPPANGQWATGGPGALEQAWTLAQATNLKEAKAALALNQVPGRALIATNQGDLFDSSGDVPEKGYLRRSNPHSSNLTQGDAPAIEELRVQNTWSFGRVEQLALSTEVAGVEAWQKRLARSATNDRLAQRLAGWNRRADAGSVEALAFYFFKLKLGRDAALLSPPDSLSDQRIFVALDRTRDVLETELDYNSRFGTLFRITRAGSRVSFAANGGSLPEAGMFTPRSFTFTQPTGGGSRALHLAHGGQAATRIVELSPSGPTATSILLPGISDDPNSPYFDDQAEAIAEGRPKRTFFRDRRELERTAISKKELIF